VDILFSMWLNLNLILGECLLFLLRGYFDGYILLRCIFSTLFDDITDALNILIRRGW